MRLKTVDAHLAGAPVRLLTEGFPSPSGASVADKRLWCAHHADHLRRALMLEPRGHRDMCGAVLVEPQFPESDAGVVFMDADGYPIYSATTAMAVLGLAARYRLVVPRGRTLVLETPAGPVSGDASFDGDERPSNVRLLGLPAVVLGGGVSVPLASRTVRVDLVMSGGSYAVVDAESLGVPIDLEHHAEIRRLGRTICSAIEQRPSAMPSEFGGTVDAVVITGPAHREPSTLRLASVTRDGSIGRAPSGAGMAAVLAVLDAMGMVGDDQALTCEGLSGLTLEAAIAGRQAAGDTSAVIVRLTGEMYATGEHAFLVAPDDPLRVGFATDR